MSAIRKYSFRIPGGRDDAIGIANRLYGIVTGHAVDSSIIRSISQVGDEFANTSVKNIKSHYEIGDVQNYIEVISDIQIYETHAADREEFTILSSAFNNGKLFTINFEDSGSVEMNVTVQYYNTSSDLTESCNEFLSGLNKAGL